MVRYTLSKQERLSSVKQIEALFTKGKSLTKFPIRLVWLENPEPGGLPVQVMFSVSKKKFNKAVDRNRIKRLLREGYRMLKPGLIEALPGDKSFHLGLVYISNELMSLEAIQKGLSTALERFITQTSAE